VLKGVLKSCLLSGRIRWFYFAIAVLVVPIGLLARSMRAHADPATASGFVATYLGDTLWAVLFYFAIATCLPRLRTLTLAGLTLLITVSIEVSQLYGGEPLATLRSFRPTRFLLGTQFLWSDIACLLVGTAMSAAIHGYLSKKR